ncbi:MAG: VWA domain-containing protein [Halioglobus sp.]
MEFHFMRPEWLWLILPAVLIALALWYQRDRAGSWQSVIAPHLLEHLVGDQTLQRTFNVLPIIIAAWVLAAVAASGPSWQKLPQPVHQKQDALVILLDLSYSMKSGDLAPSRKDRARQKLLDLMATRKEGQTGLIAFAGDAHIVTPLTDDTHTIANLLPALNPDMMPVPGSNPASAVAQGLDLLRSAGVATGRLLLVTDELTDEDTKAIAKLLRRESTALSIMSVGTPTGAPIPLPRGGFLKDNYGEIVMPGVNPAPLRALASETGGRYMAMQINDSDIAFLLADNPLLLEEQTIALDRTADAWEDQGYLLLIPLLPLMLALFRRGWILQLAPVFLLVSLLAPSQDLVAQTEPQTEPQTQTKTDPNTETDGKPSAWANLWQTPDQQGRDALASGNAERASKLFETPQWEGTAAYQHQDYEAAAEAFTQDGSADGWYNRGNSLARAGELDEAIAAYQESLKLAPGQEDAQQNLELIEKLKEQQEQQQQDQEGDGEQDQENDNKENENEENQDQESDSESGDPQDQQQNQQDEKSENGDEQASNDSAPEQSEESEEEREQRAREQEAQAQDAQQNQQPTEMPPVNPEELERDQAMEQWLRRVPDDPSGLLREKFRYESQLRQQQNGNKANNEKTW